MRVARLLERTQPLARLDAAIAGAADGRGDVVIVEGEPGIGKTALLTHAADAGRTQGLLVLSARGGELERQYAYGAVRQLFEAHLTAQDDARRIALLSGAAAHAAGVFDPAASVVAAEHGLYWLTAALAAEQPVLLVVDDAHWLDEESLRFLVYLARRLEGLPVALVVGTRPADDAVLALLAREAEHVDLAPLGLAAVATLVRERLGPDASEAFCEAARVATRGNPLLLGELLRVAQDDALEQLERPVALRSSVLTRFAGLPRDAGAVARAAAIFGREAELRHVAALAELPLKRAAAAVDVLVDAGVLEPRRPLVFVHPLLRSALYADLPEGRRAALHARAARLLDAEGRPAEQIAAHLTACERVGDAWTVERLRAAAAVDLALGAPAAATAFLRRALEEPPMPALRAVVLRELGVAAGFAQDAAAASHLQRALDLTPDVRERAAITLELARVAVPGRGIEEAVGLLERAITDLGPDDGELVLQLEAALLGATLFDATLLDRGRERLAAMTEPAGTTPGERTRLVWLAFDRVRRAAPAAEAIALLDRALAGGKLLAEQTADSQTHTLALNVLAVCGALDTAYDRYGEAMAEAAQRGSAIGFGITSCFRTWATYRMGRLLEAEADLENALRVTSGGGLEVIHGYARAHLATVLVDRGALARAGAVLASGPVDHASNDAHFLLHARARLALASGDRAAATDDLRACGRRELEFGMRNPAWIPWRSDLAAITGDQELAQEELTLARQFGAPHAIGIALAGLARTEAGEARVAHLEEAVTVLAASPARLEHARALAALGTALRAARRRAAGRAALREALDLASRCGAGAVAAHAREELVADGARPRRDALRGRDALTAGELRVARMAADGLANREIAQSLFITTKTVETHLGNAYSKLAIGGRRALAEALAA